MLTPYWQMDVFIFEALILMPIYIIMIIDVSFSRRKSTIFRGPYYTLIISQGIADTCTILIFSSLILARYFSFGNNFFYSLEPYGMAIFFGNSGPFMFVLRIFGVFLITFQRYISVCKPHGRINHFLNTCPPCFLILFHWIGALLIHTPALIHSDAHFEDEATLYSLTSPTFSMIFSITVTVSFFTIGILLILMYSNIVFVMWSTRKQLANTGKKRNRTRDIRIIIHISTLVLFAIIGFLYYLGEYILSFDEDRTRQKAYRLFYPTVSGNLSFVNPITLILLNKDIQYKMFGKILCFLKKQKTSLSIAGSTRGQS